MNTMIGKSVMLRLVSTDDAAFIYSLRTDPRYNRYLSRVDGTVENQRQWIEAYKLREQAGAEYYYIIARKSDGEPIGTVRLYDFRGEHDSFCWGSWVVKAEPRAQLAAVESAMLVYELGFCVLGFKASHFEVMKGNDSVMRFHSLFGATVTHEDETRRFFTVTPARLKRVGLPRQSCDAVKEAI